MSFLKLHNLQSINLPNFFKFCHNISHKLLRPTQYLEKLPEILDLTHFAEINPPPSLLHVAVYWQGKNTEACAKKLPQILETTLIIGEGELVSEFMEGVVAIDRYVDAKYSLRYESITTKNTPGTVWVI